MSVSQSALDWASQIGSQGGFIGEHGLPHEVCNDLVNARNSGANAK